PATTTTTPLDALPPCPVDALDAATGPVELTLWFGFGAEVERTLGGLVDQYNASQHRVRVQVENQASYENTITAYAQSSIADRADVVILPEYVLQQIADSGEIVPAGACIDAAQLDVTPFIPRAMQAYQSEGVQWAMPFNVS